MRPVLAAALAFLLTTGGTFALLSWIRDGDAADLSGAVSGETPDAEAMRLHGLERPAWRVGQGWHVHFARSGASCGLVVTSADDTGFEQGAACGDAGRLMATDEVLDHPYLGRFGRDLDGLTKQGAVRFFDWPLVDGKTWETSWKGQTVTVEARFDPERPDGRGGAEPGFALRMTRGLVAVATYDFVPSSGWWSGLELASGWRMEVRPLDETPADAVVARAVERVADNLGSGVPRSFEMLPREDMVVLTYTLAGPSAQRITLTRPGGEVAYEDTVVPVSTSTPTSRIAYLDSVPGAWRLDFARMGTGSAPLSVHAVTLTSIPLE